LPECYVERLDALKSYYYELCDMRADLVSKRGLSTPEPAERRHQGRARASRMCRFALQFLSEGFLRLLTRRGVGAEALRCAGDAVPTLVSRSEDAGGSTRQAAKAAGAARSGVAVARDSRSTAQAR